jgi:hypothetical protein
MRLPTEDDLTPEKFVRKDCASRRDSIQHHLEKLADRLKEACQVVRENNNWPRKAEGILQPTDEAGYFTARRYGISEWDGEGQTEMRDI